MQLRMLKLSVEKGRQVIKQLCPILQSIAERAGYVLYRALVIIIIIMVRRSREIIYPVMLYGHKRETFYCVFSCLGHGPYYTPF